MHRAMAIDNLFTDRFTFIKKQDARLNLPLTGRLGAYTELEFRQARLAKKYVDYKKANLMSLSRIPTAVKALFVEPYCCQAGCCRQFFFPTILKLKINNACYDYNS